MSCTCWILTGARLVFGIRVREDGALFFTAIDDDVDASIDSLAARPTMSQSAP